MDKYQDPKQPAASRTMSASQMQTGTSPRWVVTPPTPRDSGTDPNRDWPPRRWREAGWLVWLFYETRHYLVTPLSDFSKGKALALKCLAFLSLPNVPS